MIRKLLPMLATFTLLLSFTSAVPAMAATNVFQDVCKKPGASTSAVCQNRTTTTNPLVGPNGLIIKITRIVAVIAGAAAVIIIVISGLRFVLANGDTAQANTARNGVIYGLVGLLIIIMAASILSLVISKL